MNSDRPPLDPPTRPSQTPTSAHAHLTDELDHLQVVQVGQVPGRLSKQKVTHQHSHARPVQRVHGVLACVWVQGCVVEVVSSDPEPFAASSVQCSKALSNDRPALHT